MDPITIFILKLIFGPIIIGIVITLVEITLKKIEDYLRKLRTKKHLVRNAILVKKMLPNGKFRIAAGFLKDDPRISLRTGRAPNGLETKVVVLSSDDPEQKAVIYGPSKIDESTKDKILDGAVIFEADKIDWELQRKEENKVIEIALDDL